jgi:hypothetical protein
MDAFTIDLLAIFQKLLITFSGCGKRFRAIAMMQNIRGKEKDKEWTAWMERAQTEVFENRERYKNILNHETPPTL